MRLRIVVALALSLPRRLSSRRMSAGRYIEAASGLAFPPLTAGLATRFLVERRRIRYTEWVRRVREWARRQR